MSQSHLDMENGNVSIAEQTSTPVSEDASFFFVLLVIVVPVLYGLITLIGVVGNALVIYVILSKQKMRTATNLLLLNIAFADISFVIICPPITAYQMASNNWPFGDATCKLIHYLLSTTVYVTVYTLVLITINRYMAIVHNTTIMRFGTRGVIIIFMIWAVMCAVNIPTALSYGTISASTITICANVDIEVGQKLYVTFFCFAYVIPLTVIAIISILIPIHMKKQNTSMPDNTRSTNKKRQVSRLLISVVVFFALFWLPIHIHLLAAYFGTIPQTKAYHVISVFWTFLAHFNSCVNPIIYNYASRDYRDGFRDALCCVKHRQGTTQETDNDMTMITALSPEKNDRGVKNMQDQK